MEEVHATYGHGDAVNIPHENGDGGMVAAKTGAQCMAYIIAWEIAGSLWLLLL